MEEELTILRSISLTIYGHPRDLYLAWRRFVSPSSLALVDEPDETEIPIYIHNQPLQGPDC